ncbi:hypothetical protein G7B40_017690 [Aetokthonos hydrillicola Thurmond2011]|jgi:hypothetical protein|uniref:Uncharacterized protein n=1 Tax=Aetokthonos hydrillicola Thurmond2011 TaxID=2712845 RepID=A0AAP5I7G5_9CYAN|nr:hypothetical protein [Aetokthonos hydrillicola]MBO3458196.1 hypothetical protein [Aetokthonos hydrillicola CCALA 1050]MBW4584416.1 hypothetical protein [Aetokthonos hydrillicola CCALA 1050]MDR9896377.1 hypothetical protein [Aetokthonos hydrillicola Thurmond2011]
MLIVTRLPWVSLTLLLITYSILGWVLVKANVAWFIWLLVVITVLLLIESLTSSWWKMVDYSSIFLRLNVRSFVLTILAAFLFFLMIAWFKVFLDTLLIIATLAFARIEFQLAGLGERQYFWIVSVLSLSSIAGGALAQKYI